MDTNIREAFMRAATFIGILVLMAVGTATAFASYAYKCPKCGLIQSYEFRGIYKCPRDGTILNAVLF